jgi:hypothetical protein
LAPVLRKCIGATLIAGLAAACLTLGTPANAQVPELNLDVTIDPDAGPPGTVITATVDPNQAQEECLADPLDEITAILTTLATGGDPNFDAIDQAFLTALAGAIQSGAIPFDVALLYVTVFVDILTQQPVPGSDQPMWDPIQGTSDITAPEATPGTYAVAMVCFGLTEDPDPAAIADALQGLLDPSDPSQLQNAAQAVIPLLIDQDDPLGTGVALFCLDNAAQTFCEAAPAPPPVEPPGPAAVAVPGSPAFTG